MEKVCLIQSNSTFKEVREVMLECICVLQAMEWDKIRQQKIILPCNVSVHAMLLHLIMITSFWKSLILFSAQSNQKPVLSFVTRACLVVHTSPDN